jgi:hypothetical protein
MDGERVLAEAADAYRVALGDRLLAAYALGSLAHGGFSPLVSDVDLGLILDDPPTPGDGDTIRAIAELEKSKGSALHQRLSVFWGTPATLRGDEEGGRFPPLDRLDLLEHGRLLFGSDDARRGLPAPSMRELLVTGAEFALASLAGEDATEGILSPDLLLKRGVRRVTRFVLLPVRFLSTAATGSVGANPDAVAHYLEDDQAPSRPLVVAALGWRTAPPADDSHAAELLREQLLPLYLYYIDDHVERLDAIGESDLAASFRDWRRRLDRTSAR